jgi:transaldolase
VDKRLEKIGTAEAAALAGKAAVANAKVAYEAFSACFGGQRWAALQARGARVQRPLWASTSTKNPAYPDTMYVDELIGPDTVNTMPDATLLAFEDHGTLARTVDRDLAAAHQALDGLAAMGIRMDDVTEQLETDGVSSFISSFDEVLETLSSRAKTS